MSYCKLGRTSSQRKAMLCDITTDLITSGRIVTVEARTKEVRSAVEKMITLGRHGDLHARRQTATFVRNGIASVREEDKSIVVESALQKLFNGLGPRFAERRSDYTRILRIEPRCDDAAPAVVIEFAK